MATVPRRLLFIYTALLGLEIGGGTLQNTGLITAVWLSPYRDIPYGLNSSFFFPLIGLAILVTLIVTAIVGRKSPPEVKRPMYASFGIWIIIAVATAVYFIPNHPLSSDGAAFADGGRSSSAPGVGNVRHGSPRPRNRGFYACTEGLWRRVSIRNPANQHLPFLLIPPPSLGRN